MIWFLSLTLVMYAFGVAWFWWYMSWSPSISLSLALVFYALVFPCFGVLVSRCVGAISLLDL
ncbi:hypothetical protein EDC96DRAFT_537902 [Choanephora cucurbitarum]|nr:hypothetical protein EDC96DRAFT_539144 [Choanephora cucurbitarum]KAI8324042.1 hypothetical protein EDC96DRAFT_537902 [Choanephora cucurbitarum]